MVETTMWEGTSAATPESSTASTTGKDKILAETRHA